MGCGEAKGRARAGWSRIRVGLGVERQWSGAMSSTLRSAAMPTHPVRAQCRASWRTHARAWVMAQGRWGVGERRVAKGRVEWGGVGHRGRVDERALSASGLDGLGEAQRPPLASKPKRGEDLRRHVYNFLVHVRRFRRQ